MTWEQKEILITVRTYPAPSSKDVEVSCTAGVTRDNEWIRLFPIAYRFLDEERKFKKYDWIQARVMRAPHDARPESHRIDRDSILALGHVDTGPDRSWSERRALLNPMLAHCMCCLQRERDAKGFPTLGVFKPAEILDFEIVAEDSPTWTDEELRKLTQYHSQGMLFGEAPSKTLEKIPFKFYYRYRCAEATCPTHTMSCTDWELAESYRRWRTPFGADWRAAILEKYDTQMRERLDTHFYVGTVHKYPNVWIIVGLFYPPFPSGQQQFDF